MQLIRRLAASAAALAAFLCAARSASAQTATFDTTHTLFHESPSGSKMTVYTPGADLEVTPTDALSVRAGWEADVVSGASVAVKAGPAYGASHPGADVISSASVHDLRNNAHGGFTIRNGPVSLTGGYAYSTENDYKSHSFNVAARTDLFEHDTQFEISYARNFDHVCDRVQASTDLPARYRALEDSKGCFTSDPLRVSRPVDIDGLQGSWSQAWTPTFTTQLVYTAQILNGFQSNPYRSVILGEGLKTQEHSPENRARQALAVRGNLYLRPIRAALRLSLRGYRDTWDITSGTLEAELEKYFGEAFRASVRGRLYRQSGALFWSDDYTGGDPPLGPKGQYWTGDRDLSPFSSWLVGVRGTYTIQPSQGRILGLMTALKLGLSGDVLVFHYDEYTLAGAPLANARAFVAGLTAAFLF